VLRKSISNAIYTQGAAALRLLPGVDLLPHRGSRAFPHRSAPGTYYPDLHDRDFCQRSRSSTNASPPTPSPTWSLAHPYRMIAHNGEINSCAATSTGWRRAGPRCRRILFDEDINKLWPISL
jgi:glutamate synthase (NADPH/NADH) large chain